MTMTKDEKVSAKNDFWKKLGIENPSLHVSRSDGDYFKTDDELIKEHDQDRERKIRKTLASEKDSITILNYCDESVLLGTI